MSQSTPRIRVLVADDHPFFRDGVTRGLVQSGVGIWQESAANSARHVVAQLAERITQQHQLAALAAS